MNTEKILKAIDSAILSLSVLKEAFQEAITSSEPVAPVEKVQTGAVNTEALAHKLAWSYTTRHPEFSINNQFENLRTMIQSDKISFILSWICRGDVKGIEDFLLLDLVSKRKEMLIALDTYGEKIKEVFKKRFGHES